MKTTLMSLLNTPACILIRSMFMRFKVNVWLQGKKLCDASILYSMLCKILCLTTCILFCFCYKMLFRYTLFSLRRRSTDSMDGSFGEDYLYCEK